MKRLRYLKAVFPGPKGLIDINCNGVFIFNQSLYNMHGIHCHCPNAFLDCFVCSVSMNKTSVGIIHIEQKTLGDKCLLRD